MLELFLLFVVIPSLFIYYGRVCYKDGIEKGINGGELLGIYDAMMFLRKRNIIEFDEVNNIIFRVNDRGERGEAIDISIEASQKSASNVC